jgi:hypothetical protein
METVDFAKFSRDEKHKITERMLIRYSFFNHIKSQLQHCQTFSKIAAEPECILITGVRGSGKTTIMNSYAADHPRIITSKGTIVPVLKARVPSPASTKNLVTELLKSLGDPNPTTGSVHVQTLRLKSLLKDCEVEMIMLDEFHQFLDQDSYSILYGMTDWLKNLIDDTKCSIALWGLGYSKYILKANEQLERRFSIRETIKPLAWHMRKEPQEEISFFKFLKYLDGGLPFVEKSLLDSEEMAFRIYYATDGIVGFIMKLIRRAAYFAIEENLPSLNLMVLARAYDERLSHRDPTRKNPFNFAIKALDLEEIDKSDRESEQMPARVKGEKSRLKALINSI